MKRVHIIVMMKLLFVNIVPTYVFIYNLYSYSAICICTHFYTSVFGDTGLNGTRSNSGGVCKRLSRTCNIIIVIKIIII